MLRSACGLQLEGIVSKRLDSIYRSGRTDTWQKTKCEVSETFRVVGFSRDDNDRIDGLYLGREEAGKLVYAGKVENGIGGADLAELKRRLPKLVVSRSPLAKAERRPKAKWVSPEVMVEVAYPNKTADGRIRHPSFKGLRDDLTKR